MNMAMITQAIAADGVMKKPYLIKRVLSKDGKVVKEGSVEVLSEVCARRRHIQSKMPCTMRTEYKARRTKRRRR
ncbi:MAG: hypothetical protein ACLVJO_04405 [[Clostridium] scindens]